MRSQISGRETNLHRSNHVSIRNNVPLLRGVERSYRDIYEHVTDGIYHSSLDGRQLSANPALVLLNGYESEAEMLACVNDIGSKWYVDPHRRDEFKRVLAIHRKIENFVSEVYRYKTRERIWVSECAWLIRDLDTGQPLYYEGTVREVTETMRRLEHEERQSKIADAFPGCLFQLVQHRDLSMGLLYGSDGLQRLCGKPAAAFGTNALQLLDFVEPKYRSAVIRSFRRSGRGLTRWVQEFGIRLADGTEKWILGDALPHREADGSILWHGYWADVSRRRHVEQNVQDLACFDPLTRLPNRRLLQERLRKACAEPLHGPGLAVLFIDLDNFKVLNDTRGHAAGDMLLIEVARRLESCVREDDTVARLGGDEFVVLLRSPAAADQPVWGGSVGERIRSSLGEPYTLGDHVFQTTPSIGIALRGPQARTPEALLQQADIAMYQAKASGRNGLRFFEPSMQASLHERVTLITELREAVPRGELLLQYQPQVDRGLQVIGAEALLRWHHPRRGISDPPEFMPVAEETGLILPISQWVLRQVCMTVRDWQEDGRLPPIRIAFNVSPKQFRSSDFVREVRATLDDTGARPETLVIELTEHMMLDQPQQVARWVRELAKLGVRFSLDDFGTGFSSLGRLKELEIDQIKIDRSFIRDLEHSASSRTIVRTMIGMARNLDVEIVAEGVETPRQLRILKDEGCRLFQGFLFGRPESLQALTNRLIGGELLPGHSGRLTDEPTGQPN